MRYLWKRFNKKIFGAFGLLTDWALFLAIVGVGGLGTSWYMVEAGSQLTTQRVGPWVAWKAQARVDADPYTRAHFARLGTLSLSTETATTYIARTDSTGAKFDASCVYEISGQDPAAQWWSLTLFDDKGRLITNAADRYAFSRDTVATSASGTLKISMARDAHEGNWLPFGNANNFVLVLHLLEPDVSLLSEEQEEDQEAADIPIVLARNQEGLVPMSWILSRLKRLNWRVVIMALFAVGIIHISATLSASQYGDHPGYKALTSNLPINQISILPPVTPDQQPLSYMAPDTRYALCHYDTTDGAVEIEVTFPDNTWTVALHTPKGANIFAASGQGRGTEVFKIKLVPSPDRFTGLTPEARGTSQQRPAELSVVTQQGVAIVRAPIKGLSYVRKVEETLRKASCRAIPNGS